MIEDRIDPQREATQLTAGLLDGIGTGTRRYTPEPRGIYLADVEASVDRFDDQLQLVQREDWSFPALPQEEGPPIPVDWVTSEMVDSRQQLLQFSQRLESLPHFRGVAQFHPTEVVEFFAARLRDFLAARFEGEPPGRPPDDPNPGLLFRVITRRSGLRVHFTPTTFIDWRNVFGSPTTPVHGWIRPGRYMFGAVGHDGVLHTDPAHFRIPPLNEAKLMGI